MSDDRKKAFWFIALLSVLVILPFLGETFAIKEKNTNCIARNARADGRRDEYSVTPPRSDDTVAIDQ